MADHYGLVRPAITVQPVLLIRALGLLRAAYDDADEEAPTAIHPHLGTGADYKQDAASWMAVAMLLIESVDMPSTTLAGLINEVSKGIPDARLF
jgi:hypothetical protein